MWPQLSLPNPESIYEHATKLENDFGDVVRYLECPGTEHVSRWFLLKLRESYTQLANKLTLQSTGLVVRGKTEGPGAETVLDPDRETETASQMKVSDEKTGVEPQVNCDKRDFSEYSIKGKGISEEDVGQVQKGEFVMSVPLPAGEARRARSTHSPAYKESSGSGHPLNYDLVDSNHVDTYATPGELNHKVYMVEMGSVEHASMNLNNQQAMLQVVQEFTQTNFRAQSSRHSPNTILNMRWKNLNSRPTSNVIIAFATMKEAGKALEHGLRWKGKSHPCSPLLMTRVVRCTNCLRYGHCKPCNNPRRCPRCGSEKTHNKRNNSTSMQCTACGGPQSLMKCPACGGPHSFISPKCPQLFSEMAKAGLWPCNVTIAQPLSPSHKAKGNLNAQGTHESRSQQLSAKAVRLPNSSSNQTEISKAIESEPSPSDTKAILEHLDHLKTLVLATNSVPRVPSPSRSNKRKDTAPIYSIRGNFSAESPKRVKIQKDVYTKQEDDDGIRLGYHRY